MSEDGIVIIGAGQGGFQLARSLREAKFTGSIRLVGDERHLPYQRPPLSKAYLSGEACLDQVLLCGKSSFDSRSIELHLGDRVIDVDRVGRAVTLASGVTLRYQHLVIATGSRPRPLRVPGAGLADVISLRGLDDADCLRDALATPRNIAVVGGGFIGLEFAAVATASGHHVTVIEGLERAMARAVSPELSEHVTDVHRRSGAGMLLGRAVVALHGQAGAVREVELDGGQRIPADLVVVGIGVIANSELAARAGLAVDNGVVVDEQLCTSDPAISALGDCVMYPSAHATGLVRLESVQNAVDQARFIAGRLTGSVNHRYNNVPWFWTHQAGIKVQMAGLPGVNDTRVVVGDRASGQFSVFRFDGRRLVCVESVNRVPDHMAARRILGTDDRPTPDQVAASGFNLIAFANAKSLQRQPH